MKLMDISSFSSNTCIAKATTPAQQGALRTVWPFCSMIRELLLRIHCCDATDVQENGCWSQILIPSALRCAFSPCLLDPSYLLVRSFFCRRPPISRLCLCRSSILCLRCRIAGSCSWAELQCHSQLKLPRDVSRDYLCLGLL